MQEPEQVNSQGAVALGYLGAGPWHCTALGRRWPPSSLPPRWCVWLIAAPGLGPQALLSVCATCNLLELITPSISERLPVLLDVWKFALDAQRCLDLIYKALNALKDFTHSHAECLCQSGELKKTLLPNPRCWVKCDNFSATACLANGT